MTEEIMIRFNRQAWEQNRMINIDDYGVDLGTFEEQEPAPPKDWRPACWTGDLKDDLNGCTELYYQEDGAIYEPCLSCPYRKME